MEALSLPAAMPRLALKLATAFFGHGETRRVINLSHSVNPDSRPFWTVLGRLNLSCDTARAGCRCCRPTAGATDANHLPLRTGAGAAKQT